MGNLASVSVAYDFPVPLAVGDQAPTFRLTDVATGDIVTKPWAEGPAVIAFFKVTCPVCQIVAPVIQALADGGARVLAVGQDPPERLTAYAQRFSQNVPTVSESPPYLVSNAYKISAVPTIFLVAQDGTIEHSVGAWNRDRWNAVATALGVPPVSHEGDGLPVHRPG